MDEVYTIPYFCLNCVVYGGQRRSLHLIQQTSSQNSQSHKRHILDQVKLHKKTLLTRTEELEFDSNGGEYHSQDDEYSLIVPKGAIPEHLGSVSIQCGVIPYGPLGPFEYPDGVKPVSPIVWFCSNPSITFEKPVEIIIPYCLDCESEEHSKSLAFFKANHNDYTVNRNGQRIFHFKEAEGITFFSLSSFSGTLYAEHFCFYCVGVYSREDTAQANFCLITAKPVQMQRTCRIHFCLTYFLATCLKVNQQVPINIIAAEVLQLQIIFAWLSGNGITWLHMLSGNEISLWDNCDTSALVQEFAADRALGSDYI